MKKDSRGFTRSSGDFKMISLDIAGGMLGDSISLSLLFQWEAGTIENARRAVPDEVNRNLRGVSKSSRKTSVLGVKEPIYSRFLHWFSFHLKQFNGKSQRMKKMIV